MKVKNKSGFTLIEVIMSIAILSIASVIVLQLFVISVNYNSHSADIDMAGVYASNAIERAKGYTRLEVEKMDKENIVFFNEEWEPVEDQDYFELGITLTEDPTYEGLYTIDTVVFEKDREEALVNYQTKYYYHVKE